MLECHYRPRIIQLGTSWTSHRRLWWWLESSLTARQSSGIFKRTTTKIPEITEKQIWWAFFFLFAKEYTSTA